MEDDEGLETLFVSDFLMETGAVQCAWCGEIGLEQDMRQVRIDQEPTFLCMECVESYESH